MVKVNRRAAVKYAIASAELEGCVFTKEELAEFEKLANGEITPEMFRQQVLAKIERMRLEHPEFFCSPTK